MDLLTKSKSTTPLTYKIKGSDYVLKDQENVCSSSLELTKKAAIKEAYFMYGNQLLSPIQHAVPYGTKIKIVVEATNMVGMALELELYKAKSIDDHSYNKSSIRTKNKVIINSHGKAIVEFELQKDWAKDHKTHTYFYVGAESDTFGSYFSKEFHSRMVLAYKEGDVLDDGVEIMSRISVRDNDTKLFWEGMFINNKVFISKVKKISKKLRIDPNWLMNFMALETNRTFDPRSGNFKNNPDDTRDGGYVGLIQFGKASVENIAQVYKEDITRSKLLKMSALQQLDYVEKYFNLPQFKGKLKTEADLYLAILWQKGVGQGGNDNYIVFDDDATGLKRSAYWQNPSFHKEKGEYRNKETIDGKLRRGKKGGKTYVKELKIVLEEFRKEAEALQALPLYLKYKSYTLKREGSGYGKRKKSIKNPSASTFHQGFDFNYSGGGNTDIGAPVISTHDGYIHYLKDDPGTTAGRYVVIRSENGLFQTRYLHLSKIIVSQKQKIKKGQKIGELGASYKGKEVHPNLPAHLHYEIMRLNNEKIMQAIDLTVGSSNERNWKYLIDPQKWIKK